MPSVTRDRGVLYQVGISTLGVACSGMAQVGYAMQDAWGFVRYFEPVDAEHGVWLVELTDEQAEDLERDGWAEWIGDRSTIMAEMP